MSSGLKLECRKLSVNKWGAGREDYHAYKTTFPCLIKRMRSIATAAYVHTT